MPKYINPYTDLDGSPLRFKKLFGEEANKDLLSILNEPIFQKAFGTAELASLTEEQRRIYEENLIQYWGMKSAIETAVEEAVEIAVEEQKIETAKKAIQKGFDNKTIADLTDLTIEQIEQLRKKNK